MARASAIWGKKAGAIARCTNTFSTALQTEGRLVLALSMMLAAMLEVGAVIHENKTIPRTSFNDRNGGIFHHRLDQSRPARG